MRRLFLIVLFIPNLSWAYSITVYPDPGTGATTVDGSVNVNFPATTGVDWATLRATAGSQKVAVFAFGNAVQNSADTVSNNWTQLYRSFYTFDTSAIGTRIRIISATFSLFGAGSGSNTGDTPDINIYSSNMASFNNLANADFQNCGSNSFSTTIPFASWNISGYNDFVLNASGLAQVKPTGISQFCGRNENYDANNVAPTWNSGLQSYLQTYFADQTGTDNDPKLVVNYSDIPQTIVR